MPTRHNNNNLPKGTKLCSSIAVARLFDQHSDSKGAIAYPLRAVWNTNTTRHHGSPIQFVITIPKKKLRHAVDRVSMRRRVREAYRLSRRDYEKELESKAINIDVAFIYLSDKLLPYEVVTKSMTRILSRMIMAYTENSGENELPNQ